MDVIKLFQGGFPQTIETISFLQDAYSKPLKAMANLAGDSTILEGIVVSGSNVSEGWFVKNGEPVFFKASTAGATIRVIDKTIQVPYNEDVNNDGNLDYKDAYVSRFATTTSGALNSDEVLVYSFSFSELSRIRSFKNVIPIGSAILWFDAINIPAGYRVMDGTGGDIVRPEGTAKAIDLRNKFIKMAGSEGAVTTGGGARTVTLTASNLAPHTHNVTSQTITRRFGTKGAKDQGGEDYLAQNDGEGVGIDKTFNVPASTTSSGNGLTGTAFNIEPVYYLAIWIQYVGL